MGVSEHRQKEWKDREGKKVGKVRIRVGGENNIKSENEKGKKNKTNLNATLGFCTKINLEEKKSA